MESGFASFSFTNDEIGHTFESLFSGIVIISTLHLVVPIQFHPELSPKVNTLLCFTLQGRHHFVGKPSFNT